MKSWFLTLQTNDALVAQLDRALDYESRGREFESSRARHNLSHSGFTSFEACDGSDYLSGALRLRVRQQNAIHNALVFQQSPQATRKVVRN